MKNKNKLFALIIGGLGIVCILAFVIFSMMKKNIYTITFDSNGGSNVLSVTVEEGQRIERPLDPTRDGYEFVEWQLNNIRYDFGLEVKDNMTLKAIWKEVKEEKYTVTFTLGDIIKTVEVKDFSEIDLESLGFEEKEGQSIKWYINGEEFDSEKPLSENISLEGKYVKVSTFTVKFKPENGTTIKNQTIKDGETVEEPKNVTKEGYILDGWYLNSEKYDFKTKVNKSFTLVAKWSEDPNVKRYDVTFNSDGGSKVESQRIMENKTATKPKNPTKKGFVFVSWIYNEKEFDFKTKITEDIELKAKWRELEKYKVTFKMDDGTVIHTNEVNEGETVSEPAIPEKKDYTFSEWQLDGKKYDFKTPITKDITIVATFTKKTPDYYLVTFDSDGGTNFASQYVKYGEKVREPTDPKKENNTFAGWYLGDTKFNFNTLITKNITLKAHWTPVLSPTPTVEKNKYTVTFNSNGGTSVASREVEEGNTVARPTDPTKSDNTFVGWYLENSQTPYDFSTPVTSNITLTAKWNADIYTIRAEQASIGSPDYLLKVYKNGNAVNMSLIKEIRGEGDFSLNCKAPNFAITSPNFADFNAFIIVFNDNTRVTASKVA